MLADPAVLVKTIVVDARVAGSVASFEEAGAVEVTHWLGKAFWGQGIATRALAEFLARVQPSARSTRAWRRTTSPRGASWRSAASSSSARIAGSPTRAVPRSRSSCSSLRDSAAPSAGR